MTSDAYFAKPGLSFHQLKDFRRSPRYYYRKHVQKAIHDEDKPAYAFGRALHCLCLEGPAIYADRFAVVPAEHLTPSGAVSTAKPAREWIAAQTAQVISPEDHAQVVELSRMVHAHPIASGLLSDGKPEVEKFAEIDGMPVKGRADWIGPDMVVDLKTCRDLDEFASDARAFGYAGQMAWYMRLFGVTNHALIAVEKSASQRVGVFRFGPSAIIRANYDNRQAVDDLARCLAEDEWPGGFDTEIITISDDE